MRQTRILWFATIVLAAAAVAVPLLLQRMPPPLRLIAGFTNLLAAFAVAMVIRQRNQSSKR